MNDKVICLGKSILEKQSYANEDWNNNIVII